MESKTIVQRLAFANYLIQKGNIESEKSEPLSSVAILYYHDALELTFGLIWEDKDIKSKNEPSFMQYFYKINGWLKDNGRSEISLERRLNKLKDRRKNLKHKGLFPSLNDIQESKFTTNALFEELCKNIYNLDVKDISLVSLIQNEKVKIHVNQAIETYPDEKEKSIANISLAFESLLKDYQSSNTKVGLYSYHLGKSMSFISSYHMGLDRKSKMAKFVDNTRENIEIMQKTIKILIFGLEYKKYIKFNNLIPDPGYADPKHFETAYFKKFVNINQADFQFCIDFIIESALKLQEFDFEISRSGK